MNIPNSLTFLRILLSVFFALLLLSRPSSWGISMALGVFLLASATDYWDGVIARTHNQVTAFGKLMDPLADKFLVLSAFFIFAWKGLVPFWTVAVIAGRDLVVTVERLRLPAAGDARSARSSGKNKTLVQYVFIVGALLFLLLRESESWKAEWTPAAERIIFISMLFVTIVTVITGVRFVLKCRGMARHAPTR